MLSFLSASGGGVIFPSSGGKTNSGIDPLFVDCDSSSPFPSNPSNSENFKKYKSDLIPL